MKIKNLEGNAANILKFVKKAATPIVLATAVVTTSPVAPLVQKVEASVGYEANSAVMQYFRNVEYDIRDYTDVISKSNLQDALEDYDKLYDFINKGLEVRNTYYNYLNAYEQSELQYLLTNIGNEIYSAYKGQTYFSSTCKSKLGFVLNYNNEEVGYDDDHETTMERFTETLRKNVKDYLKKSNSESNLKKILTEYKTLINFIKGNMKSYGYYFDELTLAEQEEIINLFENITYDIEDEYGSYYYYSSACVKQVGFTVNYTNVYRELGEYLNPTYNDSMVPPMNPGVVIPPQYDVPNYNQTVPSVPNVPTVPSTPTVVPTVPTVPANINNTVNTNWMDNYYDPSVNTSRGVRDYAPEDIDDMRPEEDYYNYGYNNGYSNYDQYGYNSYNPYGYNNYYQYQNGYVEDYAPTYVK